MKPICIILFTLFSFVAFGQSDLIEKVGSNYMYRGEVYKCKEMGPIYQKSERSLKLYNAGRTYKTISSIIGYTGLGLILTGTLGVSGLKSDFVLFRTSTLATGLFLELIAIAPSLIGSKKLKKAFQTYNFEVLEREGYKPDTSLAFGVTKNRLGFVLQF